MRRTLAALLLGLLLLTTGYTVAEGRPASPRLFDVEVDCSAMPPAAYSLNGVTDDGREVSVDVFVLLDGVKKARAAELFEKAATAYEPVGIDLRVVAYKRTTLPSDGTGVAGRPTIDGAKAIAHAKGLFRGARPAGSDVVHVLTPKDLTLPQLGNAPAGVAECAGGVQWDDKAFSISEDTGEDSYSLDPAGITNVTGVPAETIAHEIGHLLGGLHEHKSCAEGAAPEDATNRDPSPCTIMSDVVDVASLRFGAVEAAIVRGYALAFADS